jgi:hypothetical protein
VLETEVPYASVNRLATDMATSEATIDGIAVLHGPPAAREEKGG